MTVSATERLFERIGGGRLPDKDRLRASVTTAYETGSSVFRPGDRKTRVFVVGSGLIKLVYTHPDGAEWIKSFIPEGKFFACLSAMQPGGVAGFGAEAMEKAVVEHVPFTVFGSLARDYLAWSNILNTMLLDFAGSKEEHEGVYLTLKAADRYAWLEHAMPEIAARVSQKDLAAFLGITPEPDRQAKATGRTGASCDCLTKPRTGVLR